MNELYRAGWLLGLAAAVVMTGCGPDDNVPDEDTDMADTGVDVETDVETDSSDEDTLDEDTTEDVEEDTVTPPTCENIWEPIDRTTPMTLSSPDGQDPADAAGAGEASGGRVRAGQRFFEGRYADCRVGDYVLQNEHIRVCVADERPVSHLLFTGGHVVDMETVANPGNDSVIAITPSSELITATGDEVELIADGSDGGAAVVRVRGVDVTARALANVVGQLFPPRNLDFETEYRLAPGATALEVITWVSGADGRRVGAVMSDLVLVGDTAFPLWEGVGFTSPSGDESFDVFSAFSPERSYGVYYPGMTNVALDLGGYDVPLTGLNLANGQICAGEEAALRRYYVVGDGDTGSLHTALGDIADYTETSQTFAVEGMSPADAPRFAVNDRDGHTQGVIRLDASGEVTAMVPEGGFTLVPLDWSGDDIDVTFPSDGVITITAPPVGHLVVNISEGEDTCSARVLVTGPVERQLFAVGGTVEAYLPPGDYTLEVTRGEEYSFAVESATVATGETITVDTALERQMDTEGWASGDMHQHATPSVDSVIQLVDRASANITTGLDFLAPSDHDSLGDYVGALEELGASDEIVLFQGIETSPIYGHFNMFPFYSDRELPAHGAPPLSIRQDDQLGRTVEEVPFLQLVQQDIDAGARILQANHPRGTQGLFDYASFDPILGPEEAIQTKWYDDFNSVEVINTFSETCEVARDWFSLLSRGYQITGVGNSDTHRLTAPSGYPRNYLYIGERELNEDAIVESIQSFQVSVSAGIFIDYADAMPGDVIALADGETASLHARVQTPEWSGADELVVFVNGVETQRITLDSAREDLVDFDDVLTFDITEDSYVVLFAWSATRGNREYRTQPVGFINPVFFDVDGDGWTPPGVTDASGDHFIPEVTGFSFCE